MVNIRMHIRENNGRLMSLRIGRLGLRAAARIGRNSISQSRTDCFFLPPYLLKREIAKNTRILWNVSNEIWARITVKYTGGTFASKSRIIPFTHARLRTGTRYLRFADGSRGMQLKNESTN